ncbi:non-specific lipid-transfer A-like [Olea europaea subsp. europaea]|uniref:Non-specific lipid-transfer A-like n=1 Tax=Olea europaea subsp. europaea TaxID=158383 RepID=A0A8S0UWT1_OLEEU|nr:non-specific lipid-transfer A-like [Olea europaea subsp. europaea]
MVQLFMAKPGAAISCGQSLQTTQDRQTACGCLKTAASHYTNLKPDAASQLPTKCGVSIGVPISPTVDCREIH